MNVVIGVLYVLETGKSLVAAIHLGVSSATLTTPFQWITQQLSTSHWKPQCVDVETMVYALVARHVVTIVGLPMTIPISANYGSVDIAKNINVIK
jgi:hypothetical protein